MAYTPGAYLPVMWLGMWPWRRVTLDGDEMTTHTVALVDITLSEYTHWCLLHAQVQMSDNFICFSISMLLP